MKISETTPNSGCYMITNKINGKIYIGSSVNLYKRFSRHRKDLEKNKHRNKYFQSAYNKHGVDAFEYKIIIYCDKKDCLFFEQRFLDAYWDNCKNCYNISKDAEAPMTDRKASNETKTKMSISQKGKIKSTAHKISISISQSGEKGYWFGKHGRLHTNYGRKHTTETIAKVSGENHHSTKLIWKQIREIRTEYALGNITQKNLAKKYKVAQQTVCKIINNLLWKE